MVRQEGVGELESTSSQPRKGILLTNHRSKLMEDELKKLKYLYMFPRSVEVCALEAHEIVGWVVPGWVALYEIAFKDGMRLSILKLVRDVLDHYEIAPSQLMTNAWRILMTLECLNM